MDRAQADCIRAHLGGRQAGRPPGSRVASTMEERGYLLHLGLMEYEKAWALQHQLWERRVKEEVPDLLLFVEHPHVITLGRRGNRNHLIASPQALEVLRIPVFQVERGGDVTYHGPGQIVAYPIFHLKRYGYKLLRFVEALEEVIIRTLRDFGIEGERNPLNRGVWVGAEKIASVGIAIKRWVSFHGIALNYETDLRYFDLINPCGLEGVRMTSMARLLGKEVLKEKLLSSLSGHFQEIFPKRWEERGLEDLL